MMKGLDYHHDNFMNCVNRLAQIGLGLETRDLEAVLMHEATAYLNRLGQIYYFIESDFVEKTCPAAQLLSPVINKYVIFRHKHSAHRSIDAPRNESRHIQTVQAFSMSAIGGRMFQPKPGNTQTLLSVKTPEDLQEFHRMHWKYSYVQFQLLTDDPNVYHNFSIEKEHPAIIQEAYAVLEKLLI